MCVCVYAAEKQNNGSVVVMLLVVSAVGVGTEFRDVLVKKHCSCFVDSGRLMWVGQ